MKRVPEILYARCNYAQNTKSVDIATQPRLAEQVIKLVKQEFKKKMNIYSGNELKTNSFQVCIHRHTKCFKSE